MNTLQGRNDPALPVELVEQLTELVTIAASSTGKADVTNAQVCEQYFELKVLPQHIRSPNAQDAVSAFTKDTWQDMRQAWLDGQDDRIQLWYRESWNDVQDNPALGFAKIEGGAVTLDHIKCTKPNHEFIRDGATNEIYNGKKRYEKFIILELNNLKEKCASENPPVSLEEAFKRDENYVLANATITTGTGDSKETLSIPDHVSKKSEAKVALKHNQQVKNWADKGIKLLTRAAGASAGSKSDDTGGLLYDEKLDVSKAQLNATSKLRDQLAKFDGLMKDEALTPEQVETLGNYIPS
mgnify:CR=1 FL=1|tara:strand:+ start:99 stop:989 length:891 start_codon:yes stop_codon:yes gene_type:complete